MITLNTVEPTEKKQEKQPGGSSDEESETDEQQGEKDQNTWITAITPFIK